METGIPEIPRGRKGNAEMKQHFIIIAVPPVAKKESVNNFRQLFNESKT